MKTNYYKKSGIVIMNIARDLFSMEVGERIPTILEYTEKFQVSRGVVQNALSTLEKDGCISMEKRGVKGTFLTEMDSGKLYPYTNFGSITGTMPVPLNLQFSSLTTAICEQMDRAPFPFSFAYVSGSEKRLEMMQEQMYDFMIVSQSAAKEYVRNNDFMKLCMPLTDCEYAPEFLLYFFDKNKSQIEDGMRVGLDSKSFDQINITQRLCADKSVELVEFPVLSFEDLINTKKLDCVVYRSLRQSVVKKIEDINSCPIPDLPGFSMKETRTPVILINKANYGIEKLLSKYISSGPTREIQAEVLEGKRAAKFY